MRKCRVLSLAVLLLLLAAMATWAGPLPQGKNIAVIIHEANSSVFLPGGAVGSAEAIVKQALLQNGYKVVNEAQLAKIRRSKAAALALDGNVDAIMSLGKSYGVRVFVSGRATLHVAEKNEFGLYTGTAAIAIQAYSASNGEYLFSDTAMGKEVGYTGEEASQKALMSAAQVMAQRLVGGGGGGGGAAAMPGNNVTVGSGGGSLPQVQPAYVVISNVMNYNLANQVVDVCAHLGRSRGARVTGYNGAMVTIEVMYMGPAQDLADGLSRRGLPINITGVMGNTVQAMAY